MSPLWVGIGIGFIIVGLQALIIGLVHGAAKVNREAERADQPARRPAGPDLSTTLAARIAEADQIAATGAADLDAVDQHFATTILPLDRDPDRAAVDAEARMLLAGLNPPVIPGDGA